MRQGWFLIGGILLTAGIIQQQILSETPIRENESANDLSVSIVGHWKSIKELRHYPGVHARLIFGVDGVYSRIAGSEEKCQFFLRGGLLSLLRCDHDPAEIRRIHLVQLDQNHLILEGEGEEGGRTEYGRDMENAAEVIHFRSPRYAVDDQVFVIRNGTEHTAVVERVRGDSVLVHYDGKSAEFDEWIPEKAIASKARR